MRNESLRLEKLKLKKKCQYKEERENFVILRVNILLLVYVTMMIVEMIK